MMTNTENFLVSLLDCGICDLGMIEDVNYPWCDILTEDMPFSLNYLMQRVVEFGIQQIADTVNDRICELEACSNEYELDADEQEELTALRSLCPEDDILSYHNYRDTQVWFENHADVYHTYLPEALDAFADGTGLEIMDK